MFRGRSSAMKSASEMKEGSRRKVSSSRLAVKGEEGDGQSSRTNTEKKSERETHRVDLSAQEESKKRESEEIQREEEDQVCRTRERSAASLLEDSDELKLTRKERVSTNLQPELRGSQSSRRKQ